MRVEYRTERPRLDLMGHVVTMPIPQVVFGRLLITTGARPRRLAGDMSALDNISKGLQVGSANDYMLFRVAVEL